MDPYVEVLIGLETAGVRTLVVGALAIDLYATEVGAVIATQDCDLLIPAGVGDVARAAAVLVGLGYELEAGGEPLVLDEVVVRGIVRNRAMIRARRADAQVDLMLALAGAEFTDLWSEQRRVQVEGAVFRLAPLAALVRSKELADRPKDRAFLEAHAALLRELLEREGEAS